LDQFGQNIFVAVIALFDLEYFMKSLEAVAQHLHFKWEFQGIFSDR
jgi:hypothetical protein